MASLISERALSALSLFAAIASSSCNNLIKLNEFSVVQKNVAVDSGVVEMKECTANSQCLFDGGAGYCQQPAGKCVPILTEDCDVITGDPMADGAVIIGSLFSTKGAQAATNIQRQQAAILAVEHVNATGGIPSAGGGRPRELVLVSCDEVTNLERAARHLVDDLQVPAIVGPNTSQDTITASNNVTSTGGTLVMTPTAVASGIASLNDHNLTWLMVPTDVQRAPLMISQINGLETRLKAERGRDTVRLGVVYREDALGTGTRTSLNSMTLNGKPLVDSVGTDVHLSPYDYKAADQQGLINDYVAFKPDIIVLAGTAEAITAVMVPLEAAWPEAEQARPEYVLIDSVKVPELITAAADDNLRQRVRGTGITPSPVSVAVYNAFKVDYKVRFPDGNPAISGMGPTYDATLAIAFAISAARDKAVTGSELANGLKFLSGGATEIPMGSQQVLAAFQKLGGGDHITSIGTFAPLEWDSNGAVVNGTIEMWCINSGNGTPAYASSGLTYDIKSKTESGTYTACQ